MRKDRHPSLRWRIVRHLTVFQSIVLLAVIALVVAVLVAIDIIQINEDDDTFEALESAVALDANDKLVIRSTPALVQLRQVTPDLWFVVRDQQGRTVREGQVPDAFARLEADLDGFGDASIAAAQKGQRASIRRIKTEAGPVVVLTNALTTLAPGKIAVVILAFFVTIVLPIFTPLVITTVIVTHLIVRRGVAGLQDAAAEAERIDVERRGARLPVAGVPSEIVPLVNAVNNALARLDEGYERHKRFLADAAHEIRTPIAILQTRLEALAESDDKHLLLEDVARLALLAEQLLDLQRLDRQRESFAAVELVGLGRQVAAELAPLAISAGYDLSFESAATAVAVSGDAASLERALANLVQNAIAYGGRKGAITIRVEADAAIEVQDEGPGIPPEERERIFEPFYRVRARTTGAGLGLYLVWEIARLHGGRAVALDGIAGGACFRIELPVQTAA
ncbi:HAMP domain-containing sensor histidine kinase [Reyranella sp. CPCC 100927]|uniref:sensor histidine kinase n=1 Tax=Reyranella sp. CPCC 100927 TaxID=2599616 RepID=UPI00210854FE|nr:HAMP domain-containing sensor histidine kinase [Reyranella sp. CPCC 100927]